ncbi:MAG: hypothetical protein NW241_01330 [Bacteroidia bacterium]|nr:hypothetical protein [Bacteroidia bacterium]
MNLIHWLSGFEETIGLIWTLTLIATAALYAGCNLLPDRLVGPFLPLHDVFKPRTNVDLDYQSIGYVLLHTTWVTRITHATVILDALLWFVIFQSWHESLPYAALGLMLVQSLFIGDRKFGFFFLLMGAAALAGALALISWLGMAGAVLTAQVILMLGGLMRMLGHAAEPVPPLLVNDSDQFTRLSADNVNWKVPLASLIGYVGEFGSGLPSRILPVQANYLYQTLFRVPPKAALAWPDVKRAAQQVLSGGYTQLAALERYYRSVTKERR